MVYAMHQIQVACILHHGQSSEFFRNYLRRLVDEQLLLASATTELGVGGDLRSSLCAVEVDGDEFTIEKKAPVISYALSADAILVTSRRSPDAKSSDQVHVLVEKEHTELDPIATWDTLGFRGTCSLGFVLRAKGNVGADHPGALRRYPRAEHASVFASHLELSLARPREQRGLTRSGFGS